VNKKYNLPELCKYRELSSGEQMAIHQILISYVRENHLYNIVLPNNAKPFNLVKLVSINFENESSAIWINFKTITGESFALPIDLISRIEISGQEEI